MLVEFEIWECGEKLALQDVAMNGVDYKIFKVPLVSILEALSLMLIQMELIPQILIVKTSCLE